MPVRWQIWHISQNCNSRDTLPAGLISLNSEVALVCRISNLGSSTLTSPYLAAIKALYAFLLLGYVYSLRGAILPMLSNQGDLATMLSRESAQAGGSVSQVKVLRSGADRSQGS